MMNPLFPYLKNVCLTTAVLLFTACHSSGNQPGTSNTDSIPPYALPAPQPVTTADQTRIKQACEAWYDSALLRSGFNGGMLVAKNGNIIFEKYRGTIHLPGNDIINENTSMQIASTSKTFTAMAVLKLWQDGKLDIDDDFKKYFPAFNYPGVTIRSLLNHRSGLPNYLYFMEYLGWDKTKMLTNEDVLQSLITRKSELKNIATPNKHFSYCNTNYALLALLIEKVSGKKYPRFLKENFFNPLRMKNSMVYGAADINQLKPSYDGRGRIMPVNFLDAVYGDKNVYTTPRDLLLWDRALRSGLIFSAKTLEQAYTPYSNERSGVKNYGLGWRMNVLPGGKKMIYHNGWWHGSNSTFIRLLDENACIIIIGNKFNRNIYHAKVLADIFGNYFGEEMEDETDNLRPQENDSVVK